MRKIIKNIWTIFDDNQKFSFSILCLFSVISTILELLSIGFVVPIMVSVPDIQFPSMKSL